ncbi:hypothetical protein ACMBCM_07640 [Spiroplasma sp. K1]
MFFKKRSLLNLSPYIYIYIYIYRHTQILMRHSLNQLLENNNR